ncbi:MAG: histidine kinase [Gammaproteobacteria bacterium]|nr:histidine kinase [Gammaproteobacteria bacterium]
MHPIFYSARHLIAVSGLWLALTFIITYFLYLVLDVDLSEALILFWPLLFAYFFFCIANYFICLRLPIRQTNFLRLLTTQIAGMLSTIFLWLVIGATYVYLLNESIHDDWFPLFRNSIVLLSIVGAILYCFWILAHYVYLMAEQHDRMERSELQRKLLISQTELQAIKASVHPHFLFNSLNTLANLALVDPKKVHEICLQIAEFLRYSVSYGRKKSATIGDELIHIKNYLDVEKERFGARLETHYDIDENLLSEPVLPLLLFPLIENSIKHGIDNSLEGGLLTVSIKKDEENVVIRIENPHDEANRKHFGESFGLQSVRKRLNAHYGEAGRLNISRESDTFIVDLIIPLMKHN